MRKFPFTYEQASNRQYRYHSRYSVWLIAPDNRRSYLSCTSRKSMQGLQAILHSKANDPMERKQLEEIMNVNLDDVSYKRKSGQLLLSNGWRIAFGGTILQEAQEQMQQI